MVGGISGTGTNGILALADGGDIDIGGTDAIGDVTGARTGISARTTGTGNITINSSAGSVLGDYFGIAAYSNGTGSIDVTTADVTSTGLNGIDLFLASGTTGDISFDSTAGSVAGQEFGISIGNFGTGSIAVTTADVTATNRSAISAFNQAPALGNISVDSSAGTVTGGEHGIFVDSAGSGSVSVITADVTGMGGNGILIRSAGGIAIDSTAGSVTGDSLGIFATNNTAGNLSITSANITSTSAAGIIALNYGGDLTLDTTAGAVIGGADLAIFANNRGTGDLTVTTADLTGVVGDGLQLVNEGVNLTIDTSAGTVIGEQDGIQATNYGTGALSITTADVTGSNNVGILAVNGSAASDLTIDTVGRRCNRQQRWNLC